MISNADVRNKALAKVKDKNFSVLSATAYAIAAVPLLCSFQLSGKSPRNQQIHRHAE